MQKKKELVEIARKMGKNNADELFEVIGYNQVSPKTIINKLPSVQIKEESQLEKLKKTPRRRKSTSKGVKVEGMDDLLVRIAKCCNPVPGDKIIGYITRGRGVSVHRTDCPNLLQLSKRDKNRLINVYWNNYRTDSYEVNLVIDAFNKKALLNDITSLIKEEDVNLLSVMARTDRYNRAKIELSLELSSLEHMRDIINKLEKITGVLSVKRAKPT